MLNKGVDGAEPILAVPSGSALVEQAISVTPHAVRAALTASVSNLEAAGFSAEVLSSAEIVLAEALNNVVEHAFRNTKPGEIILKIWQDHDGMICVIRDNGDPLPQLPGTKPGGKSTLGPVDDLPEGGFGLLLMHQLAQNLQHVRDDEQNVLYFRIGETSDERPEKTDLVNA